MDNDQWRAGIVGKVPRTCTETITDPKTKKVRRCRARVKGQDKKCGMHKKTPRSMVKLKQEKTAIRNNMKIQIIKLASMGLKTIEIGNFYGISATVLSEKHAAAYKKGRQLWEESKAGKVELYASLGMSQEATAKAVGISPHYLVDKYGGNYDKGSTGLRLRLRAEQVRVALADGNPKQATMLIFLGKNYLGQRDKFEVVHTYDMDQIEHVLELAAKTNPAVLDQFIAHIDGGGEPMEFIRRIETGRSIEDAEFEEIKQED